MLGANKKMLWVLGGVVAVLLGAILVYKKHPLPLFRVSEVQKKVDTDVGLYTSAYSLNEFVQFNKAFDTLFQDNMRVFDDVFTHMHTLHTKGMPFSRLKEETKQFVFSVHLPGISVKDTRITVQNRTLCVVASKQSQSHFSYCFLLPDNTDSEKITAKRKQDILEVTVQKNEKSLLREVLIQAE